MDNNHNSWNESYPIGGNYWSDYSRRDMYSGPNQNQPGSDGIGDKNRSIGGGTNFDEYPLMSPHYLPEILDLTTGTPTTGENFFLNVNITDDTSGLNVWVEYWFNSGSHNNESMLKAGNNWTYEITAIPQNALELSYIYHVKDKSLNWVSTNELILDVIDNDPPQITDNSMEMGYTDGLFNFSAEVIDNINVSNVYLEYWFGNDIATSTNVSMTKSESNVWDYSITLPVESTDTLHYILSAEDTSNNWFLVTNDVYIYDSELPTANAGNDVIIEAGQIEPVKRLVIFSILKITRKNENNL